MTVKTFKKKLIKALEENNEFATDLIEMGEIKRESKKFGFDDVVYVAGDEDNPEDGVFLIYIQKICL